MPPIAESSKYFLAATTAAVVLVLSNVELASRIVDSRSLYWMLVALAISVIAGCLTCLMATKIQLAVAYQREMEVVFDTLVRSEINHEEFFDEVEGLQPWLIAKWRFRRMRTKVRLDPRHLVRGQYWQIFWIQAFQKTQMFALLIAALAFFVGILIQAPQELAN